MNRFVGAAVAAAVFAFSAPASAVPFTFAFGSGGTVSGSGVNKSVEFSSSAAPDAVKVKVSGWTNDRLQNPDTIEKAEVMQYGADSGVGVVSTGESAGSCCEHATDNLTRTDFLVLRFNQAVNLNSAYFTPWDVNNIGSGDSDASIYHGNNGNAYSAALPYENQTADNFYGNFSAPISLPDVDGLETISAANIFANTWIVSASTTLGGECYNYAGNDYCWGFDAFKLKNVSGTTQSIVPPAVPEPATWAMMISGFGLIGSAMRRKSRQPVIA